MLGAFSVLAPIEAYPKAKAAAAKALEIDPTLAQAEIAKSYASYLYDRDWETAERGFRHALDENPNYGPGHQWYAVCLVSRGRFDDARSEIRRALEVDPTSLIINAVVAWIDYLSHDSEAAIAAAKRAIEMDANFPLTHMYLGEAYASAGRYDDAAAELRKGGALQGRTNIGYVGFVLCRAHRFDDARKVLLEIQERSRREYISPYHEALIHLGLGDKEKAIDLLGRAADQHYPWVIHYNVEPVLDSLQNEKRFKLLLRRIGLPDLSGRFGPEKSRLR
jgi:tetratricopeptide (TPR) repeat protein